MHLQLSGAPLAVLSAALRLRRAGVDVSLAPEPATLRIRGCEHAILRQLRAVPGVELTPEYALVIDEASGPWTLRFPREPERREPAALSVLAERAHTWATDLLLGSRLAWAASAEAKARPSAARRRTHPLAVRSHPDLDDAVDGDAAATRRFREWCRMQLSGALQTQGELRHLWYALDLGCAVNLAFRAEASAARWQSVSPRALAEAGGASAETLDSPIFSALETALDAPSALEAVRCCLDYSGAPVFTLRVASTSAGTAAPALHFEAQPAPAQWVDGEAAAERWLSR